MKFPSISIVYNRLKYQNKSGTYPVYLRLYHKSKTDFLRIKEIPNIHHSEWIGDSYNGLYVKNLTLNNKITQVLHETRNWSYEQVMSGNQLTVKIIKNHFQLPEVSQSFNNWCKYFVRTINKNKSDWEKRAYGTIQAYRSYLLKLDEFDPNIQFDEINPKLIHDFDRFLATKYNLRGVTRKKHFDKFKNCYKAACQKNLINYDPLLFTTLKIKEERSRRVSLTLDEIVLLKKTTLENPTDEYFKSIFLFSCLTGLYYSDIKRITSSNFQHTIVDEKSIDFIKGRRSKNDEEFVIPLFEDTKTILNKYTAWKGSEDEPIFKNLISDQKYNDRLKRIALQLGINKKLSAKVGRHSFAELMISKGMSKEKVGKALGHQIAETTEIYARQSTSSALRGWMDIEL